MSDERDKQKREARRDACLPSWGFFGMWIGNYLISPPLDTVISHRNSKISCYFTSLIKHLHAVFDTVGGKKGMYKVHIGDIQCHRGGPGDKHKNSG